jgi:AsmA family
MKSTKKILAYVAVSILVILLVLIVGFHIFGAGMIKAVVEKTASSTLGVPVTVKSIDLSILRGKVEIKDLVVNNPPGYANKTLLELGDGVVNLDIGSLMSNTIKIQLVKLDNTKLTIEQKGLTNNLNEILDKLPKEEKAAAPKTEKPGKNLTVTKLEITNTNVRVKLLPIPGKSDTVSLKLDPIVMENLGTDKKLSVASLVAKVMGALAMGVAKQGAGVLPDEIVKGIGSTLGKTAELGMGAVKTTTEAGKNVVEGVKGIFGGKKK